MGNEFNPKESVESFIKNRELYFKRHINKNRFYSLKYQFLFGVDFVKEKNNSINCTYIKVENLEQSFELLKELEVFEIETAKQKLNLINKDFSRGCDFPCYIALCEKFISFNS